MTVQELARKAWTSVRALETWFLKGGENLSTWRKIFKKKNEPNQ